MKLGSIFHSTIKFEAMLAMIFTCFHISTYPYMKLGSIFHSAIKFEAVLLMYFLSYLGEVSYGLNSLGGLTKNKMMIPSLSLDFGTNELL
jgi:hypothetical protein